MSVNGSALGLSKKDKFEKEATFWKRKKNQKSEMSAFF